MSQPRDGHLSGGSSGGLLEGHVVSVAPINLPWEHKTIPHRVPLDEYWEAAINEVPYLYTVRAESVTGFAGATWMAMASSWSSTGHATADEAKAAAQKHWDEQA